MIGLHRKLRCLRRQQDLSWYPKCGSRDGQRLTTGCRLLRRPEERVPEVTRRIGADGYSRRLEGSLSPRGTSARVASGGATGPVSACTSEDPRPNRAATTFRSTAKARGAPLAPVPVPRRPANARLNHGTWPAARTFRRTPYWRPGIAASSWHGPKEESGPGASDTARSASPSTQPPAPTPGEEYLGGRILPVR